MDRNCCAIVHRSLLRCATRDGSTHDVRGSFHTPDALQQEYYYVAAVHLSDRGTMKIALAPRYRNWMVALFPMTLGLGTAVFWVRSLNWPLIVDETGLTLRSHRRVEWHSVRAIGLSRSYLDGHVSHLRIHHEQGTSVIPVCALRDGEAVARTIVAMFKRTNRGSPPKERLEACTLGGRLVDRKLRTTCATTHAGSVVRSSFGNMATQANEFAMLRRALARRRTRLEKERT
jgi:hypothetical protein